MGKTKASLMQNEAIINKINNLVNNTRLEDALELNIRTYEEALANDQIELSTYCLYFFGIIEDKKANSEKAMDFYKKATILARKNRIYKCLIQTLIARGNTYMVTGKLHIAIAKYLEAISIIESNPEFMEQKDRALNSLGILYLEVSDYEQALKYLIECAQVTKEKGDKLLNSTANTNITEVYIKKEEYLKAKYYNRISEQISIEINDEVGIAITMANEAIILNRENHNWIRSHELFKKSLELIYKKGAELDKDDIIFKYGEEAFYAGEIELAEKILKDLANDANRKLYYNIELNALKILEKIYLNKGEYEDAYKVTKRHLEINKSSYSQWKNQSLENLDKNMEETTGFSQVDDLQKSIKTLKLLSEIGRKITACINEREISDILMEDTKNIFKCDSFGVGIKSSKGIFIEYRYYDENGSREFEMSMFDTNYLMSHCIKAGEDIIIYDTRDEKFNNVNFSTKLLQIIENSDSKTIIFCPIKFENNTIGGITIQSDRKGRLSYLDLESLRILAAYLAIAYTNLERSKELVIVNKKLEQVSLLDGLTGVYNRHALGQYMSKEFIGMIETKLPAIALMIDIDYFKQYNDNYGHVMGDKCLKKVCGALRNSLSSHNHKLFRYGGDEFFVVIEKCDLADAEILLNKILSEMKRLNIEHVQSKIKDRVTITIGAAIIDYPISDYTIVFTSADEALYEAKDAGRNNYAINIISQNNNN